MAENEEVSIDELKQRVDAAFGARQEYIDSHEPPLSDAEQARLDELNRLTLQALSRYYGERDQ